MGLVRLKGKFSFLVVIRKEISSGFAISLLKHNLVDKTTAILKRKGFIMSREYGELISLIRTDVTDTHNSMLSGINFAVVMLYWRIGNQILAKMNESSDEPQKILKAVQKELHAQYPYTKLTFELENFEAMLTFARDYSDKSFVEEVFTQISWEATVILLKHIDDPSKRHWYVFQTLSHQWSAEELRSAVEGGYYELNNKSMKFEVIEEGLLG